MSHTARWKIFVQDFCRASPQICENWNAMMSSYPKVVWLFIKTNSNGFFRTDVYPTKVDRLISHDNPTVFPFICLDMFASKIHDKTLWNHGKSCFLKPTTPMVFNRCYTYPPVIKRDNGKKVTMSFDDFQLKPPNDTGFSSHLWWHWRLY